MAFDAFLDIKGVPGESQQKGFEKKIDLYSFSIGASNPVTIGQGTGAGGGKVSISSFNVMKRTDLASGPLFQACCSGTHYPECTVTLRKAGGTAPLNYLVYKMKEVYVDSIQWSGSTGGDDAPTESVSLSFATFSVTYTEQQPTGAAGAVTGGGWDVRKGIAVK
jgi:type VI secretion system secreted protein Hcp